MMPEGMKDVFERVEKCVANLDSAWSEDEKVYRLEGNQIDSPFSVAVRYAHIFMRTKPELAPQQVVENLDDVINLENVRRAIAAMDAAWKPVNPAAPQGDQRGTYDQSLDDATVRTVHLAMKGSLLLARAITQTL